VVYDRLATSQLQTDHTASPPPIAFPLPTLTAAAPPARHALAALALARTASVPTVLPRQRADARKSLRGGI
jgi:hypothetical protein